MLAMPIYEYNCKRCGDFEITQRISEDPLKKCPTCGAKVSKLISTSAFHLKGSGWYMTDYGKSGASKSPDGESSTSSKATDTKESSSSSASSEGASKESSSKKETSASTSSAKETAAST
jgi:putative FmdB family regulatory protein